MIKMYPGPVTAQRRVKVMVPGKFFPGLEPAEQKVYYPGEAVEAADKRTFPRPGAGRTVDLESGSCASPMPWTTPTTRVKQGLLDNAAAVNRWRTYKNTRDAELEFLDELPTPLAAPAGPPLNSNSSLISAHTSVLTLYRVPWVGSMSCTDIRE